MEVKRFDIPNLTAIRGVAAILVTISYPEPYDGRLRKLGISQDRMNR